MSPTYDARQQKTETVKRFVGLCYNWPSASCVTLPDRLHDQTGYRHSFPCSSISGKACQDSWHRTAAIMKKLTAVLYQFEAILSLFFSCYVPARLFSAVCYDFPLMSKRDQYNTRLRRLQDVPDWGLTVPTTCAQLSEG